MLHVTKPKYRWWLIALAMLGLVVGGWLLHGGEGAARNKSKPLGLFTSLPILWNESADIAGLLAPDQQPHWAKAELERHGSLVALDRLSGQSLAGLHQLIMAQPRALAPDENVALDQWLRDGGQLLLFADPALTEESAFGIGDKRRPQDMVMLSPILTRWGLALSFDDEQATGEQQAEVLGTTIPLNLPGSFALQPGSTCQILNDGRAARCVIGKGQMLAIADAALLERGEGAGHAEMLGAMIKKAFATTP